MVYVLYNKSHIVGFSDSIPKGQKYFVIEPTEVKSLAKQIKEHNWHYLTIRNHKPKTLSYSIDISEENCIGISDNISFKLIETATRDLKTAQQDLEAIVRGEEIRKKY